jgi:hypothetical protein
LSGGGRENLRKTEKKFKNTKNPKKKSQQKFIHSMSYG